MFHAVLFGGMGLLLRWLAGAARPIAFHWGLRWASWPVAMLAGWAWVTGGGGWTPIWPMLVLGVVGGVLEPTANAAWRRRGRLIGDIAAVGIAAAAAVRPVEWALMAGAMVVLPAVGLILDWLHARAGPGWRLTGWSLALASVSLAAGLGLGEVWYNARSILERDPAVVVQGGVLQPPESEQVGLTEESVGWLTLAEAEGQRPGAVVFHGADAHGSKQRAAVVLRRALKAAGYDVLAVDHPGFGQTPVPEEVTDPTAWDPVPAARAAAERLRERPKVGPVIAVGHSMGCATVYQLLGEDGPDLAAGVVFGSGVPDPDRDEYWYRRFHEDRGLSEGELEPKTVEVIEKRYYHAPGLLDGMKPDHPPVIFGQFSDEWENIRATRDRVYASIPGRKARWPVQSNHYFNAYRLYSFMLAATRPGRELTHGLARLRDRLVEEEAVLTLAFLRRHKPAGASPERRAGVGAEH